MIGRCQRCGSACEGPLCRRCQAIVAGLQAQEQDRQPLNAERKAELKKQERKPEQRRGQAPTPKKHYAAAPQHREPNRRARSPAVVVYTFRRVGQLRLHRLDTLARFYCVTCRQYKLANLVATTRGDWNQTVCNTCYRSAVKPQGKAKKKAPKRTRQLSKTVRHEQLKRRNGLPAEPATAKGQSKRKRKRKGKKGEKAPPSQSTHHGIFTEYHAPRAPRWSPRVFGRNRPPSDLG